MNYLSSAALAGIPDARVTPPAATGLHTFVAADYATRVQSRADECLTKKEITRTGLSLKDHPIHVALDEDGWTLTCVDPRQAYPQEAIGGRGDIEPWKEFYDANLRGFDLSGLQLDNYVDLGEADLRGADLRGTSLRGAKLRNAVIRISRDDTPTRLEGADFTKADVSYIH